MSCFFGAGDEARTRYLDLGKVALYQMSYARKSKVDYSAAIIICQPCIYSFFSPASASLCKSDARRKPYSPPGV